MACGELKTLAPVELTLPQSEIPWSPGRSASEVLAFVVAHGEHVFPVVLPLSFYPQANFSSQDNYLVRIPPACHGV